MFWLPLRRGLEKGLRERGGRVEGQRPFLGLQGMLGPKWLRLSIAPERQVRDPLPGPVLPAPTAQALLLGAGCLGRRGTSRASGPSCLPLLPCPSDWKAAESCGVAAPGSPTQGTCAPGPPPSIHVGRPPAPGPGSCRRGAGGLSVHTHRTQDSGLSVSSRS